MTSSDAFFRQVLERLGTALWVFDAQLRSVHANATLTALVGCAPADIQGRPLAEFMDAASYAGAAAYLGEVLNGGVAGQQEWALRRPDGSTVWVLVAAARAQAEDEAVSLACVLTDISELKASQSVLRETEQRYQFLVEHSQDHIFLIDRDDRILFVNRAAAGQLRTTPDQLVGRRRAEVFPPDISDRQKRNIDRAIETGKPLFVEGLNQYGDRQVWLGTWLTPLLGADGSVRAVFGAARDITERKRTEELLKAVVSKAPLLLWATTRSGVFEFCAGPCLESPALSTAALVGQSVDDAATGLSEAFANHVRRALAGEGSRTLLDVRGRTFDAWCAPRLDEDGAVTGAIGVAFDVTAQRRLEDDLANARKIDAIGRLAGGVAHDLNNNLTAILGCADVLLAQHGGDREVEDDLLEIRRAAERAGALVRQLLAFGRRQVVQPRIMSLNALVQALLPILDRLLMKRIQILTDLDLDVSRITGDPGQVEQVVLNLVLNARDAMPAGGTLTIVTREVRAADAAGLAPPGSGAGPFAMLAVRDTGVGIDPHARQHLFEPFFTTKPVGDGTGLGLSTVHGIVSQMGGFMRVDSEIGRGSTFELYWPAARSMDEPAAPSAENRPGPSPERPTILLVEDESAVRRFAKTTLDRRGWHVIEAASPAAALAAAAAFEGAIHVLLTDVVMPGLNGPELAERLRASRADLAVLFMSGYPAGFMTEGPALDASVRLIAKPFSAGDLVAQVEELLARQ